MTISLSALGWSETFAEQVQPDEAELAPARVAEVHRDRLSVFTPDGTLRLIPTEPAGDYAVGDWVLHDGVHAQRRLEAQGNLSRKAAGHVAYSQRIAANVDTLGIVSSCNADFNIPRLERYLALAASAGCLPLVILTKPDLAEDPQTYLQQAQALSPDLTALAINAKDTEDVARLHPWCNGGQTLALLGSSGVGKTTLRNKLTGESAATQGVRSDDAKGRHTTTSRSLVPTLTGGWLIDTPGMRELQLADTSDGIDEVFDDLVSLASTCKFRDCAHESEPGCAIQKAIKNGTLEPDRLERWRKLQREDAQNSASIARQRARDKQFTKMVKGTMKAKKHRSGR